MKEEKYTFDISLRGNNVDGVKTTMSNLKYHSVEKHLDGCEKSRFGEKGTCTCDMANAPWPPHR